MRFDDKIDMQSHMRSLCGENVRERDETTTVFFMIPTKESVRLREITRREIDEASRKAGAPITGTLPDYQYEEMYKAQMNDVTNYWEVFIMRNNRWEMMHGLGRTGGEVSGNDRIG